MKLLMREGQPEDESWAVRKKRQRWQHPRQVDQGEDFPSSLELVVLALAPREE